MQSRLAGLRSQRCRLRGFEGLSPASRATEDLHVERLTSKEIMIIRNPTKLKGVFWEVKVHPIRLIFRSEGHQLLVGVKV